MHDVKADKIQVNDIDTLEATEISSAKKLAYKTDYTDFTDLQLITKKFAVSEDATGLNTAKSYADGLIEGLKWKNPVRVATTAALPAFTHASGVLTAGVNGAFGAIDGITLAVNNAILVKDETSTNQPFNGIYIVTDLGSATTPWKLSRRADADTGAELQNAITSVNEGTANAEKDFTQTSDNITLGTTNLVFIQKGAPISNSTTTYLTAANLNAAYPSARIGQEIICESITDGPLIYKKGNSNWYSISLGQIV